MGVQGICFQMVHTPAWVAWGRRLATSCFTRLAPQASRRHGPQAQEQGAVPSERFEDSFRRQEVQFRVHDADALVLHAWFEEAGGAGRAVALAAHAVSADLGGGVSALPRSGSGEGCVMIVACLLLAMVMLVIILLACSVVVASDAGFFSYGVCMWCSASQSRYSHNCCPSRSSTSFLLSCWRIPCRHVLLLLLLMLCASMTAGTRVLLSVFGCPQPLWLKPPERERGDLKQCSPRCLHPTESAPRRHSRARCYHPCCRGASPRLRRRLGQWRTRRMLRARAPPPPPRKRRRA